MRARMCFSQSECYSSLVSMSGLEELHTENVRSEGGKSILVLPVGAVEQRVRCRKAAAVPALPERFPSAEVY